MPSMRIKSREIALANAAAMKGRQCCGGRRNPDRDVTLRQLAEELGVSEYAVRRATVKAVLATPAEWRRLRFGWPAVSA